LNSGAGPVGGSETRSEQAYQNAAPAPIRAKTAARFNVRTAIMATPGVCAEEKALSIMCASGPLCKANF
jgi:hypothetical protein